MRTDLTRRHLLQSGSALAVGQALGLFAPAAQSQGSNPATTASGLRWHNWSGVQQATPAALPTPANEAELVQLMRTTQGEIRAVGSGHSFTALVPTSGAIVSLDRLSGVIAVDKAAMTATVHGGTRLGVLSRELDKLGLGLRNLPDIDVQTIAGAISTATHGTGITLPPIHADVVGLRIVKPGGEVVSITEKDRDLLAAARVSLGSLGVISQVTMRVLPAYNLAKRVWVQPIDALLEKAPELARQHRNFEMYYLPFTGYGVGITHDLYDGSDFVVPPALDDSTLADLRHLRDWLGRFPALRQWVAQKLIDPNTVEVARQRSWKLLSTVRPMKFNESEWHLPREQGIACLREVIRTIERRNEVYFPMEFRFIKADDAWLSPFYQRETCSIAVHASADEPYQYLLDEINPLFRARQGRPHWGKLHLMGAAELSSMYPRWADFQRVRQQFDPQGRMLNTHLRKLFVKA
ncbi:D-arabinono-1,4-lactone oxidase [Aquabacterium sp.]|uniref:D-arabinono-1,4-lactone oxidase n=1 Tax=Aquabacterium sp. TaxID=1872578 RepID=UPI0035B2DE38